MTVLAEVLIEQPPALPPEADPAPDLLAAALSYAARGWRIFRLKPRDKSPLRSPGHHAATTNAETVRAWWAKSPEANIGHVPPLNVQVVDVDGPAGRATIASLSPPETVIAETGGGGWHYYYRLPAHVTARNMTKTGLPGVHLKAAPGGYLVAPPSVHPDTGQRYTWADGLAPGEVQIAPAPDWVLALLTAKPKREATSAPTPEHVNEREEIDGRADVSTDGLPLSIPEGTRNCTLFRHGCRLRGRGADHRTIFAELLTADAERCRPALHVEDPDEVPKIAASAAKYAAGRVRIDNRLLNGHLSPGGKRVAALLAFTGGRASQEDLAALAGVTVRTLRRWRAELVAAGLEQIALERPARRYTLVPVDVLLTPDLSTGAHVLRMTLGQLADHGEAQVGQEALAARIGAARRTLRDHRQELEDAGLIVVARARFAKSSGRREETNRYLLVGESQSLAAQALAGAKRTESAAGPRDAALDTPRDAARTDSAAVLSTTERGGGEVVPESFETESVPLLPPTASHGGPKGPSAVSRAPRPRYTRAEIDRLVRDIASCHELSRAEVWRMVRQDGPDATARHFECLTIAEVRDNLADESPSVPPTIDSDLHDLHALCRDKGLPADEAARLVALHGLDAIRGLYKPDEEGLPA